MAKIRIYNDIIDEQEKLCYKEETGADGISFKDIREFLNTIPDDDKEIEILIHCKGGDCTEGWAIYDALRNSGKSISTTVEGECSSIATVILLAAPSEHRNAHRNAKFCLHNPALPYIESDCYSRLTADNVDSLVANLEVQSKALRDEQDKLLDLYVERTGGNRKALQSLMDKDTYIDAKRAQELGFITNILVPNTASKRKPANYKPKNNKTMAKSKTNSGRKSAKPSAFARFLARTGMASIKAQVVTAANGDEVTIERSEGDPQVGDTAYPNGSFILDDGTTIVVENEVITDIIEPGTDTGDNDPLALVEDPEEIKALIAELQAKLAELDPDSAGEEQKVEELEKKVVELEQTIDEQTVELKKARPIVDKVEKAGGMTWLNGILGMKSTFNPQNRRFTSSSAGQGAQPQESKTAKALREHREAAEAKRKARLAGK